MTRNDVLHQIISALEESGRVTGECNWGCDALNESGEREPPDRGDYVLFTLISDNDSRERAFCCLYARDIGVETCQRSE